MVLTISSRKGGCGKTVLAMILAATLAEDGADVALLDTDPNHAAHRWATDTRKPPIQAYAEADAERLAELLPTLAERHELLIIDTAGFGNQAAMVAAAGADLVLVPITPGEGDLIEAQRTVSYVEGLGRSTRRAIPVRVVAVTPRHHTVASRAGTAIGTRAAAVGDDAERVRLLRRDQLFRGVAERRHVSRRNRRADSGVA
jgi:chromosome partitioning protein